MVVFFALSFLLLVFGPAKRDNCLFPAESFGVFAHAELFGATLGKGSGRVAGVGVGDITRAYVVPMLTWKGLVPPNRVSLAT